MLKGHLSKPGNDKGTSRLCVKSKETTIHVSLTVVNLFDLGRHVFKLFSVLSITPLSKAN